MITTTATQKKRSRYKCTRTIRKSKEWKDNVIIAMTANAMQGDPEICLEAGMDDDMTKPFKREVLASSVGKWVHKMIA